MEEKRYPLLDEEESAGMACESAMGSIAVSTTADDITTVHGWIDDLDWSRLPSLGPFSEEDAISRIDRFEERLAKGEIKWISSEEAWTQLYEKYPWLR